VQHIDNFLGRLTGVVRQGTGWRACCPVHDDSAASLMISLGHENRILFCCHVCGSSRAACDAIIARMGIKWRDTYAKGKDAYVKYLPQAERGGKGREEPPDMELDRRNQAYTYLASRTKLTPEHEEELLRRGLDRAHIHSDGYFSVEEVSQNCLGRLLINLGDELYSIPGFTSDVAGRPRFAYDGSGLFIPVRDENRRIVSGQLRTPQYANKYIWLRGSGSPCHIPLLVEPGETVWVTEGPLKADVCSALGHLPIVGIAGVACWRGLMPALKRWHTKRVVVAYDSDWVEKKEVRKHMMAFEEALKQSGYDVDQADWLPELAKGLDDLLAAGFTPKIKEVHRSGQSKQRQGSQTRTRDGREAQLSTGGVR